MLSYPEVRTALNSYYVPVEYDYRAQNPPELVKLYRPIRTQVDALARALPPEQGEQVKLPVILILVNGEGRVLAAVNPVLSRESVLPLLYQVAGELGVSPGPPLVPPAAPAPDLEPEQVGMALTARFLPMNTVWGARLPEHPDPAVQPKPQSLPSAEQFYQLRLECPTEERFALPATTWKALLPTAEREGFSWQVDRRAAEDLLWLFRPPTHNCHPRRGEVRSLELWARVESVTSDSLQVRLYGQSRIAHPWFPETDEDVSLEGVLLDPTTGRDAHWADASVLGFATFDRGRRRLRSLEVTTVKGTYWGEDGTRLPFAVAMYAELLP